MFLRKHHRKAYTIHKMDKISTKMSVLPLYVSTVMEAKIDKIVLKPTI